MNKVLFIFKRDLKRLLTNWVALLVVVGICVLPALYAWFNIAANMDPYAHTKDVKIAVASEDVGANNEITGKVNVGNVIVDKLKENDNLGWTFVTRDEAEEGVKSGEYYAAIIITEDFSSNMLGFIEGKVDRPVIDYYVNEKKSAIAPKVTNTGASVIQTMVDNVFKSTVTKAVAETMVKVSGDTRKKVDSATGNLAGTMSQISGQLDNVQKDIGTAHKSYNKNKKTIGSTRKLLKSVNSGAVALSGAVDNNVKAISDLQTKNSILADDIRANRGAIAPFEDVADSIIKQITDTNAVLAEVNTTMSSLKGTMDTVPAACTQANAVLDGLEPALESVDSAMMSMKSAASSAEAMIDKASGDLDAIYSTEAYKELEEMSAIDVAAASDFMSSPIEIKAEKVYAVENYGSGMAPFYTMLAIWVSGLILVGLFKLEVDIEEEEKKYGKFRMRHTYFGRGLLFTVIGLIQAIIIWAGDIWLMGVQCVHPIGFLIACLISSIVFVNLIYALAVTLRHVGKAFAVILAILQIPGSSGTYPIEMTGDFFQKIHPLLPFSYGISALRECIAGFYGHVYFWSLAGLLVFLVIALIIGLLLRPLMRNLNSVFDNGLKETDLLMCEEGMGRQERRFIKKAAAVVSSQTEVWKFYESVKEHGIPVICLLLIVSLLPMFMFDQTLLVLWLWIGSIIAIAAALIFIEYFHAVILEEETTAEENGGDAR